MPESGEERVQRRLEALALAAQHKNMMQPRSSVDQAIEEILALAESILDESYGGREEHLAAMPYSEYLQSAEWRERRTAAYKAAGYRCQLCGVGNVEIHAHHRDYKHRGRPEELDDIIVLCRRCHTRAHDFIWKVE
jgi:hypothetical protein